MSARTRRATAVIMTRGGESDPQVFLAQRAPTMRFMGGYWAFPGGNLSEHDALDEQDSESLVLARCAAREVFEETGVLASMLGEAALAQGRPARGVAREAPASWRALLAAARPWRQWFRPVCRITTPEFFPVRFETDFLHLPLRDDEAPQVDGSELVDGRLYRPAAAIEAWERGEMLIAPPVLLLLRLLAAHGLHDFYAAAEAEARALAAGKLHPVTFTPGCLVAPLRTPTLPPATTTNTLVAGSERLYVVDPGSGDAQELQRLFAALEERRAAGARLEAILMTHHHADHVGGVEALSQRFALPVRAHPAFYERVAGDYRRGEPLGDGDRIPLGRAPDGSEGWHLEVLHTPGHAVDHLSFIDSRYGAAIVGDLCSTVSTIIIDPPEGHLRTYLESLERLLETAMTTLYPAHGVPDREGKALVRRYLAHRAEREAALLAALDTEPRTPEQLVPAVYTDVPEQVYPLAARSLLAGLIKLEEDGKAAASGAGWIRAAA